MLLSPLTDNAPGINQCQLSNQSAGVNSTRLSSMVVVSIPSCVLSKTVGRPSQPSDRQGPCRSSAENQPLPTQRGRRQDGIFFNVLWILGFRSLRRNTIGHISRFLHLSLFLSFSPSLSCVCICLSFNLPYSPASPPGLCILLSPLSSLSLYIFLSTESTKPTPIF